MGIYYTAKAIVGFRIKLDAFYTTETVESCSHKPGAVKFCPTCGMKVATHTQRFQIDEYDELMDLVNGLPNGYVHEIDDENNVLYIGRGVSAGRDEIRSVMLPDVAEIRETIAMQLADVAQLIGQLGDVKLWLTHVGR